MTEELRFDRVINAPRDVVFELFTAPEGQVAFYKGGEPDWIVHSHCDLRVGGVWSVDFGPSEDQMYRHRHVFEAIEPPRLLRMTTTEFRLDGSSFDTTAEFVFEERGHQTLMTMIHRGFPTEELRDEHETGVPRAFDEFARLVEGGPQRK